VELQAEAHRALAELKVVLMTTPREAAASGRLLAVYCMGEASVLMREPAARRRKLARQRWRLLTDAA